MGSSDKAMYASNLMKTILAVLEFKCEDRQIGIVSIV